MMVTVEYAVKRAQRNLRNARKVWKTRGYGGDWRAWQQAKKNFALTIALARDHKRRHGKLV